MCREKVYLEGATVVLTGGNVLYWIIYVNVLKLKNISVGRITWKKFNNTAAEFKIELFSAFALP